MPTYVALQRIRHPKTRVVIEPGDEFDCDSLAGSKPEHNVPPSAVKAVVRSAAREHDAGAMPAANVKAYFESETGQAFVEALIEKRLAARSTPPPPIEPPAPPVEPQAPAPAASESKTDELTTKPETPESKGAPQQFQRPHHKR